MYLPEANTFLCLESLALSNATETFLKLGFSELKTAIYYLIPYISL